MDMPLTSALPVALAVGMLAADGIDIQRSCADAGMHSVRASVVIIQAICFLNIERSGWLWQKKTVL